MNSEAFVSWLLCGLLAWFLGDLLWHLATDDDEVKE